MIQTSDIGCEDFRQFIDPYLDGEFDEQERSAFDRHLTACGPCRRHFEQQSWMQSAIKPALRRPTRLSPAARDRLCECLRAAERPARMRRAARRVAAPLSTIAAMAAIVLFVTPLAGFKPTVADDAVDQHCQRMPVEMPTPVEQEVEQWFDGKVPFAMSAPRFRDDRVVLLGGRLSRVGRPGDTTWSRPAAYLVYGVGTHKLSVLVFDGKDVEFEAPVTEVNGTSLHVQDARGYRVAMFQRGNLAYAVTSDLPREQMLALIGTTL